MNRWIIGACVLVFALWCAVAVPPWLAIFYGQPWEFEKLGQWGDAFGALNALFSAAAFIAVLITLRLQSKEMAGQQTELEQQRKRVEDAERQARIQQFEANFFQLFELFRELRDKVGFKKSTGGESTGRQGFEMAFNSLVTSLGANALYPSDSSPMRDVIRQNYIDCVHRGAEMTLGPYYRVLYTILRRISEMDDLVLKQKAQYGNLVRSQLSSAEVGLIAANALTGASNNFEDYVQEFRLLKYLPSSAYRTHLEKIYPAETFLARD